MRRSSRRPAPGAAKLTRGRRGEAREEVREEAAEDMDGDNLQDRYLGSFSKIIRKSAAEIRSRKARRSILGEADRRLAGVLGAGSSVDIYFWERRGGLCSGSGAGVLPEPIHSLRDVALATASVSSLLQSSMSFALHLAEGHQ